MPEYDRLGIVRGPRGTELKGDRAVEHLQVARRQVDGDRGERGRRLPPAVRGDRPARARRRPALRDPSRARRAPGRDRGDRRRRGRAQRDAAEIDRVLNEAGVDLRPDLHDRRHLRGPAVPGARDAARARRPRVRPVHRARDRPEVLGDAGRGALVGDLGGGQPQPARSTAGCSGSPTTSSSELQEEGVL